MGAYGVGSKALESACRQVYRTVEASRSSEGILDVGGECDGSKASTGSGSQGNGSMEEQGVITRMGSMVRASIGDETTTDSDDKGHPAFQGNLLVFCVNIERKHHVGL